MRIISGIYKITCTNNSKIYIGSSNDISRRWMEHKSNLKHNRHCNPHLQNCWNKYGKASFQFDIIEEVDIDTLIVKEQYWLDTTKSYDHQIGLNISNKAEGTIYMAEKNSKSYIITLPDGKEKTITNLSDFCRKNQLSVAAMSQVALGNVNQHKGFLCRHKGTSSKDWQATKKRNFKSGGGWKGQWIITTPDNQTLTVDSLTSFCKEHKLSQGNMTQVANGKRKQHKGYTCKFATQTQ